MPWEFVDPGDVETVERCIQLASMTSEIGRRQFGTSELERDEAIRGILGGMAEATDGNRYVQIMYLKSYRGFDEPFYDDAALFFQKMKWMSANTDFGDVWVLTVAFAQDGLIVPEPGTSQDDTAYIEFLNSLTEQYGPLQSFITQSDVNVTSLFTVGPVADAPPNRNREISWLEYVARDPWLWTAPYGQWLFGNPIYVDAGYTGMDGEPISAGALEHWGFPDAEAFELTEIGFMET